MHMNAVVLALCYLKFSVRLYRRERLWKSLNSSENQRCATALKEMTITFIQKHCYNIIGARGEIYVFSSALLHFNSAALIFCVMPPKLTVMYFTDESHKTICLTKKKYVHMSIWLSSSPHLVRTSSRMEWEEWKGSDWWSNVVGRLS